MSGFQTYLDAVERQTGVTPREFIELAAEHGLEGAKPGAVIEWLKADYSLGHGHAANLAQLITKGPDAISAKYGDGEVIHIDGIDNR